MICNIAVVENSLLVVEEHLVYAAQVVTYDADTVAHVSAGKEGVCCFNLDRTYVMDRGFTAGKLELVGLVLAGCEAEGERKCCGSVKSDL